MVRHTQCSQAQRKDARTKSRQHGSCVGGSCRSAYRNCATCSPTCSGEDGTALSICCTFGAVMATEVNCGQVRGPLQLTFSRSPWGTSSSTQTTRAPTDPPSRIAFPFLDARRAVDPQRAPYPSAASPLRDARHHAATGWTTAPAADCARSPHPASRGFLQPLSDSSRSRSHSKAPA